MLFADLSLALRLERTEGFAAAQFASARRRLHPESGSEWAEIAGTIATYDGPESPVTQTFGLGLLEPLTPEALDQIEAFFRQRSAPILHEVSPFAGVPALELLVARGYRPVELSSVLYRSVEIDPAPLPPGVSVRVCGPQEAALWADISTRGWSHDHPEFAPMMRELSEVTTAREGSPSFLAEFEGEPGAAGVLCLHEGVALFGGAATVPELRRRGLQSALLAERMRFAAGQGCDLAMIVAQPGSDSQRNAERRGFRVAYTRTKWQLSA